MANPNLTRRHQKIFSENATNNGQFGSLQTGTKVETPDISVLQALAAYQEGWSDAVISGEELPSLEEFNGLHKIETEQLQYLLNKGIPEYSADAEYYIDDIQREVGGTKLYKSLTDNNIGNALTDVANWQLLIDLAISNVAAASQAEVDAGVVSDKFVAPNTLLGLFSASSQSANGYVRIPVNIGGAFDEIIIQWGLQNESSVGTFPITFPNSCLSLVATYNVDSFVTDGSVTTSFITSTSQFRVRVGSNNSNDLYWIAIGY